MKYLSVCSGIEAATVAWHGLGWTPAAFSEIEAFPSKVLAHHYPEVKNLGDMTKFEEWNLDAIDLLVGGTPCQSFSVAGLRKGLDDPRGNLMLTFGAIAKRFRPKWLVWENVPGVLSSNDGRDFATFLGMLAELGYGFAYRVLDAQYFGVAQRRRRVFVVGCLGDWRAAAAVLFELASMSGNPAPSREKGQRVTPGSLPSPQYGGSNAECADTVTSKWAKGSGGPSGNEGGLFVAQPVGLPEVMSTLLSSTAGVSRPGNAATEHETYIPMAYRKSKRAHTQDDDETWVDDGIANTVNLFDQGDTRTTHAVVQPIPLDSMNIFRSPEADASTGCGLGEEGEAMFTITKTNHHAVAQPVAIDVYNQTVDGNTAATLTEACGGTNTSGPKVMQSIAIRESGQGYWMEDDKAGTLRAEGENRPSRPSNVIAGSNMAVRRLTPRECERLQGFPDDYTNIKENCPDGPRYKALGNSMAVPVMRWIGDRIRMVNELPK